MPIEYSKKGGQGLLFLLLIQTIHAGAISDYRFRRFVSINPLPPICKPSFGGQLISVFLNGGPSPIIVLPE